MPGILAVILFYWVATAGFRARHPEPYAPRSRRLHRRLAWVAFSLAAVGAASGTLTTLLLRDDLELAASRHFWAGWGLVALLGLQALTSRYIPRSRWARGAHMAMGVVLLGWSVAVAALGLGLLP